MLLNIFGEFRSTRFFSFSLKNYYTVKKRAFKFIYFKNKFYDQKAHKKLHIRHITLTLFFQAVFEVLLLQNGKKCQNAVNFLGTSLKYQKCFQS